MGRVDHNGGSIVWQYAYDQSFHVSYQQVRYQSTQKCLEPCCFAVLFREFHYISPPHSSHNHKEGWKGP